MLNWRSWEMSADAVYATLEAAGVPVPGHHEFKEGDHSPLKLVFRNLLRPGNEALLAKIDRALAFCILAEIIEHGLKVDCLIGPNSGGQNMAYRQAALLLPILGRPLPVITNLKVNARGEVDETGKNFKITTPPALLKPHRYALRLEDVTTTGGSQHRLEHALEKVSEIHSESAFAIVNRAGQTAETLGVQRFVALVDRAMPIRRLTQGEPCLECEHGVPLSSHH